MRNIRIISRLDIKAPNLVKGVQLEGLRKIGDPTEYAQMYYRQHIDEILYIDIVASLYERNSVLEIVEKTTEDIFVPITIGGGLRSVEDVAAALRAGADKISINTAAIKEPKIISEVSRRFGSQCMVLSIEAKNNGSWWEAYFDNGRERSGYDVTEWAKRGQDLGAGEIILTSVDREGTGKGLDIELIRSVSDVVTIPVIASGGVGCLEDTSSAVFDGGADAIAMAHVLHYGLTSISEVRNHFIEQGIPVREIKK